VVRGFTIQNGKIDHGGGIHCFDSYNNVTIENNFIAGNMAAVGGGLDCDHAHPTVRNNIFLDNTADIYGGAICCFVGRPGIMNCTFSGNSAGQFGGGVFCRLGSFATISNCIFWEDIPEEIYVYHGVGPTVTYSNVQNGYPGEGNMDTDPLFHQLMINFYILMPYKQEIFF